jgi:hypothetical protein
MRSTITSASSSGASVDPALAVAAGPSTTSSSTTASTTALQATSDDDKPVIDGECNRWRLVPGDLDHPHAEPCIMSSLPGTPERPCLPSIEVAVPGTLLLLVGLVAASGAGEMLVWYTIRGNGILAYLLLTASVVAGLLMTNKTLPPGQARVDLFDVHSFTALPAIVFSTGLVLALTARRIATARRPRPAKAA